MSVPKPMYLRFKRRNQTVFLDCDGDDVLGEVKKNLSAILKCNPDEMQLHQYLTKAQIEERIKEARHARIEADLRKASIRAAKKAEEELKNRNAKGQMRILNKKKKKADDDGGKKKAEEEEEDNIIPALDELRTLKQLGLANDDVIFWIMSIIPEVEETEMAPGEVPVEKPVEWEEINVPGWLVPDQDNGRASGNTVSAATTLPSAPTVASSSSRSEAPAAVEKK